MFRREMGSKRGSLPPKEGDLTCMLLDRHTQRSTLDKVILELVLQGAGADDIKNFLIHGIGKSF